MKNMLIGLGFSFFLHNLYLLGTLVHEKYNKYVLETNGDLFLNQMSFFVVILFSIILYFGIHYYLGSALCFMNDSFFGKPKKTNNQ